MAREFIDEFKIDEVIYTDQFVDCFASFHRPLLSSDTECFSSESVDGDLSVSMAEAISPQDNSLPSLVDTYLNSWSNKFYVKSTEQFHVYSKINGSLCLDKLKLLRCRQWVKITGNEILLTEDQSRLHKRYFICGDHFDRSDFSSVRLKRNVIPVNGIRPFSDENMIAYDLRWGIPWNSDCSVDKELIDVERVPNQDVMLNNNNEDSMNTNVTDNHDEDSGNNFNVNNDFHVSHAKKCCVLNCTQKTPTTMFTFPNLRGKCSLTLEIITSTHFKDSDKYASGKRLHDNAIPTNVNCVALPDEIISNYLSDLFKTYEMQTMGLDSTDFYHAAQFEQSMKNLDWQTCEFCNVKILSWKNGCPHQRHCVRFRSENNMDPGSVPVELKDLSFVEEQLISQVHPVIALFKLKGIQYGYSGNVINFCQDVNSFTKQLPMKLKDLPSILTVKFDNKVSNAHYFRVRAEKVVNALKWLKANNPWYADIEINEENVQLLPEDDNVYNVFESVCVSSESSSNFHTDIDGEETETDEEYSDNMQNSEAEFANVYVSGLPQVNAESTENQIKSHLEWPIIDDKPINEFSTEGYICRAFPTLFCYGTADLRSGRLHSVSAGEYFKHLLNYKDGRFARHLTFRFFALNSWMRWSALDDGKLFIKNNKEFENMTIARLKTLLQEKPHLIKKLMYYSSNLRGTRSYWNARCGELTDMVSQFGLPTFFLTLSSADMHWPDLYKLLDSNNYENLTEKQRRDLLQNNPNIVDAFFSERVEKFITQIICKKFKIIDYWYRIEYQHRGSPHMHGIFWMENAPDVSNLELASQEELVRIADFFSNFITAENPDPNISCEGEHPCRILFSDVPNNKEEEDKDLARLLVKVQRHTKCSPDYCMKKPRGGGPRKCRFNFPFAISEKASLSFNEKGDPEFIPKRNDPKLNKYCKFIIQMWRANIDISPVLSKKALLQYLAKYISKSEIRSESLSEFVNNVLSDFEDDQNVIKATKRIFIRTSSERDYSAQEVCHLLSNRCLYSAGGRKFVTINFAKQKDYIEVQATGSNEGQHRGKSAIEKYQLRPAKLNSQSLYDVCHCYSLDGKWSNVKKRNILRVFPKLKLLPNNDLNNEEWYRQMVLLHVPWSDENTFLEQNKSWKELYDQYDVEHINQRNFNIHSLTTNQEELAPNTNVPHVRAGNRDIDLKFDWMPEAKKYEQFGTINYFENFINVMKTGSGNSINEDELNNFDISNYRLSSEQEVIVNQVNLQIQAVNENMEKSTSCVPNKRTIVQGKAGTGKSLIINYIRSTVLSNFGTKSVLVLGPTGVCATQIGGQTIHSGLHISSKKPFSLLDGKSTKDFCDHLRNVKFLIIDEYSMIGCSMLRYIDLRCRQGKGVNEPFGNLVTYFLGDIAQLPPVIDTALYGSPKDTFGLQGKGLIATFDKVFFLQKCFRQEDSQFLEILDRISTGASSVEDFKILSSRFYTAVTNKKNFDSAMNLFSTKQEVWKCNDEHLESLLNHETGELTPVLKITAQHNCRAGARGSDDDAEGLQKELRLAKGCKIMLKHNLWVDKGLVNGALGEVVTIIFKEDYDFPSIIMCKFYKYTGPSISPLECIVPIPAVTKSWMSNVAYGCSIYKSQGLTLEKAIIDLGEKEFALGLTYVALSRVKSLNGLLLKSFNFERLTCFKDFKAMKMKLEFIAYLKSKSLTI
ncbi:ATP-dependent DNA helicase [Frankliniella fusca]|uniref:ATP-dependent DNA helicase n=1 Tax=Frankliniella fusca TaxID=407009 RepID=A0AAE1LEE4_9NEOP|nr:ATP-dependent DNA helicase [Frankliniella fusca]